MPLVSIDFSENCLAKSSFAKGWDWLDGRVLRSTLRCLNLSQNNVGASVFGPLVNLQIRNVIVLFVLFCNFSSIIFHIN